MVSPHFHPLRQAQQPHAVRGQRASSQNAPAKRKEKESSVAFPPDFATYVRMYMDKGMSMEAATDAAFAACDADAAARLQAAEETDSQE